MKAKIVGIRNVNFTDQQTGNVVSGKSYFYEFFEDGVEGMAADKVFVTDQRFAQLSVHPVVGEEVNLEFSRYGKLSNVTKI